MEIVFKIQKLSMPNTANVAPLLSRLPNANANAVSAFLHETATSPRDCQKRSRERNASRQRQTKLEPL